ncbi:hypothetical protein JDV02_004568 [Purpureocillium takamizusanense]|uniref:Protein kinase domain-containing protein n=1 Tax=Purpureocillium takamizusanense TaxID=2060973 RepID=A0A9Q8QGN1_9HYPO|nr:uncharacterized protein JDV02_004568 [Purpureocillium takamizusanense]UNI18292.1 hypothetical protein JDV02_004568 [Purpureocillium takamizusanense]
MSEFTLVDEIDSGVWSASTADVEGRFLARRVADYHHRQAKDNAVLLELQHDSLARVLNHENIVSLVGRVRDPGAGGDFFVWDYCDGGSLDTLLRWVRCESTLYHLPEALCWHVLRALVRAVAFLHDGKRLDGRRWTGDAAWSPILHRAIEPRNVFFQQPRGGEAFGPCKLGGFGDAAVTGHVMGGDGTWPCSVAATVQTGWEPLEETRPKIARDPEKWKTTQRAYTLSDELWSVGSVVFTMMSGRRLALTCQSRGCVHVAKCSEGGCLRAAAELRGCRCVLGGCEHVPESRACTHDVSDWHQPEKRKQRCNEAVVNIDSWLALARYSCWLRDAVKALLDFDPHSKLLTAEAVPFAEQVEEGYRAWEEAAGAS